MNNTVFFSQMLLGAVKPTKIQYVSDNLTVFGHCTTACVGDDDPRWLISVWVSDTDGVETYAFANGSNKFNCAWSERFNLTYRITPNAPAIHIIES